MRNLLTALAFLSLTTFAAHAQEYEEVEFGGTAEILSGNTSTAVVGEAFGYPIHVVCQRFPAQAWNGVVPVAMQVKLMGAGLANPIIFSTALEYGFRVQNLLDERYVFEADKVAMHRWSIELDPSNARCGFVGAFRAY